MSGFQHMVVDLETTGTDPCRSHVVQIAAVKFNPETREVSSEVFDRCLYWQTNRTWDEGTRDWWLKDKREIFESLMARMEDPLKVLQDFREWAGIKPVMWAKPSHFEHPFLQSLFKDYGMQIPFHYRTGTIDMNSWMGGRYFPDPVPRWEYIIPFQGPPHNALYDCFHQLKVIYKGLDRAEPTEEELGNA